MTGKIIFYCILCKKQIEVHNGKSGIAETQSHYEKHLDNFYRYEKSKQIKCFECNAKVSNSLLHYALFYPDRLNHLIISWENKWTYSEAFLRCHQTKCGRNKTYHAAPENLSFFGCDECKIILCSLCETEFKYSERYDHNCSKSKYMEETK